MHTGWLRKNWLFVLSLIAVVVAGRFYLVPFVLWVQQNLDLAQSYAALAIAFLTFFLILVTAFYAWTTRGTLKLLRKDIEYRTQPIIDIDLKAERITYEVEHGEQDAELVKMTIRSTHAPARLLSAKVSYSPSMILSEDKEPQSFMMPVEGEVVSEGETRTFEDYGGPEIAESIIEVSILFEDLVGLRKYKQTWSALWGQSPAKLAQDKEKIRAALTRPHRKRRLQALKLKISRLASSIRNYLFAHDSSGDA